MRAVPNWAVATAAAAPLLLVAGWTVAEARQPAGYDPIRDTISELAGQEAVDAWIMISALVLLGCCYLAVAAVLHAAGLPSRFLLAVGGVATIALVAFPAPLSAVRSATASRRQWRCSPWRSGRPARHCGFRAGTTPSTRAGRTRPGRSVGRWG